jgi:hypothetical protein
MIATRNAKPMVSGTKSERDEEEVISDRDAELPAIQQHCHGRSPERACPAALS